MWLLLWLTYFIVWISLFILNFQIFRKFSWLNVDFEIIEDNNPALWAIIKGQLIWQAIMIWSLIYFFGTTLDQVVINWDFNFMLLIKNIFELIGFWFFGIIIFQITLRIIEKFVNIKKEILLDQNEALWKIIEWALIAISIILSLSIYSY